MTQTNGGMQKKLFWTKRGVIRLGFFIKSERAKNFRNWIEDIIIEKISQTPETPHQNETVQTENHTLDLDSYTQKIEKIFKLVELLDSKSVKNLYLLIIYLKFKSSITSRIA